MMTKKMQMLRMILMMTVAFALALTPPALAQERDGQQPTVIQPTGQRAPSAQPELSTPREPAGSSNTNVKIELTITDQRPEGAPVVKTVTATVADRSMARIRTSGSVRTPMGGRDVVLNVDASPSMLNVNGVTKLRLVLVIEYRPVAAESDTERTSTPSINEQLTVVLEDGKPLMVSQSADPSTDRRVKVEVKASIMR